MTSNQPTPGTGWTPADANAPYGGGSAPTQPYGMPQNGAPYQQGQFTQPAGGAPQPSPQPQPGPQPKKPWYKQWWVWLIVAIVIICIISSGSKAGNKDSAQPASSSAASSQSTSSATASASSASGTMDTEGDVGNYHVKLVSAVKSTADYQGKDTIIVTYEWTNNSDSATSFAAAVNPKVFQNGVSLNIAVYTESPQGYDPTSELNQVQPGATQDVTLAYTLTDSSDVTVEVDDLFGVGDSKVTHTYTLS